LKADGNPGAILTDQLPSVGANYFADPVSTKLSRINPQLSSGLLFTSGVKRKFSRLG